MEADFLAFGDVKSVPSVWRTPSMNVVDAVALTQLSQRSASCMQNGTVSPAVAELWAFDGLFEVTRVATVDVRRIWICADSRAGFK